MEYDFKKFLGNEYGSAPNRRIHLCGAEKVSACPYRKPGVGKLLWCGDTRAGCCNYRCAPVMYSVRRCYPPRNKK